MPFTAAHPALVLPLIRPFSRFRAGSALVIGSVIPDIVYFLPWPRPTPGYGSHTLPGLLVFCLPMGLAAVIGYEVLFRKPLESLLPRGVFARLLPSAPTTASSSFQVAAAVVAGVLIGALTHIGWDLLANPAGAVLRRIPWATTNLLTVGGYRLYPYRIAEHGGTLLGLLAIAWMAVRSCRASGGTSPPARVDPDRSFRIASVAAIVVAAGAGGIYGARLCELCEQWRPADWLQIFRFSLQRAVVWGGRWGTIAFCFYSVVWLVRQARKSPGLLVFIS
jgi:hypothetical protein